MEMITTDVLHQIISLTYVHCTHSTQTRTRVIRDKGCTIAPSSRSLSERCNGPAAHRELTCAAHAVYMICGCRRHACADASPHVPTRAPYTGQRSSVPQRQQISLSPAEIRRRALGGLLRRKSHGGNPPAALFSGRSMKRD